MDVVMSFTGGENGQQLNYEQIFPREVPYLEKINLMFFPKRHFSCPDPCE